MESVGEKYPVERPDRKVLAVWRLSSTLTYLVVLIIASAVALGLVRWAQASVAWLLLPIGVVALYVATMWALGRQWENWTYSVTPEGLEMRHGWLWRQRRVVALDRIQHVDFNSGPIDRRFGLVQVVVHTAGTTVGMIPGITLERAETLRAELMSDRLP